MTITHTVKLQHPSGVQYEMQYFTFSLTYEDLPEEFRKNSSMVSVFRAMEYMVQRELINLQLQAGHMSLEVATGRIEYLRQCLGTDMLEAVQKFGL